MTGMDSFPRQGIEVPKAAGDDFEAFERAPRREQ